MNNNMNFDPITGQPLNNINQQDSQINNNIQPTLDQQTSSSVENQTTQETVVQPINIEQPQQYTTANTSTQTIDTKQQSVTQEVQIQNQLQSIPTVEQDKQEFINNMQSMNKEKKEDKKPAVNFIFIIILFVVILVAIYFIFPLLLDYI